jgi:ParB-like chromosome segregation protein Spo0J
MNILIEIRTLPIERLIPAPYNPRKVLKPTDPAYRKLRASLEAFGLVEPLVWNERTGHVVGGHARLRILKELGYAAVPVSVVRLTDAQEKALNVVLNNSEAQGRYDTAQLTDLLEELQSLPEGRLTGFTAADLRTLRFEPVGALPEAIDSGQVEVTLVADTDTFAALESELDALVRRYDLLSHVRRG